MPNYDAPGYCAFCHESIAIWNAQGQVTAWEPGSQRTPFRLDDGSRMDVMLCVDCIHYLQRDSTANWEQLMQSVRAGWEQELRQLGWSAEQQADYRHRYCSRFIIARDE